MSGIGAGRFLKKKILDASKFATDEVAYSIAIDDLTWLQQSRMLEFARSVEPWLLDNIGEFGVDWFVEVDDVMDSLRLTFKDQETETYFTLAWMHGAKNSDTDDVQS